MTKSNWSPAIGECVDTPAGQATVTEIYYDGDLGLVWSDHPEDVYSLPVSDVTQKRRRRSPSPVTTSKKRQRGGTTYTKQMTTSKTDQNAMFVEYLQALGRDMRQLRVMVLDTRACHSIRALVGLGDVDPRRLHPSPTPTRLLQSNDSSRPSASIPVGRWGTSSGNWPAPKHSSTASSGTTVECPVPSERRIHQWTTCRIYSGTTCWPRRRSSRRRSVPAPGRRPPLNSVDYVC